MRLRTSLLALTLVAGALSAAAASAPREAPPALVTPDSSVVTRTALPLLRPTFALYADSSVVALTALAPAHQHAPAPKIPLAPFMAFAAVGATKRRTSRRAKGVKIPDVPLFLDSDVHVMRDGELTVVRGGQLVDDTDLEDEEIEELKEHKAIRPATASELAGLEQQASNDAASELATRHAEDRAKLVASHEQAVSEAQAAGKSESDVAKLREKQAAQLSTLDAQQAKEKAKQQEAGA
jgi:hypothetical protein